MDEGTSVFDRLVRLVLHTAVRGIRAVQKYK